MPRQRSTSGVASVRLSASPRSQRRQRRERLPLAALARRLLTLPRVGEVELVASQQGLRALHFTAVGEASHLELEPTTAAHAILDRAERYLVAYASRSGGDDGAGLPAMPRLDLTALTPFTREVLQLTSAIAFGQTQSYGTIAWQLGKPGAARAVGQAMGRNPVPILIPCHRVLAGSGLGGFSCGDELKRILLAIEGVTLFRR
jgi:O-6-methylguanine DNA methyltransferase